MSLGADFRHRELVQRPAEERLQSSILKARSLRHRGGGGHHGPRRVRTARGAKVFGQPIGTIITPDMIVRAQRSGKLRAGEDPNTGHPLRQQARALGVSSRNNKVGRVGSLLGGLNNGMKAQRGRVKPVEPNNPHAQRVADYRNRMQAAKHEDDLIGIVEDLQGDSVINTKAYDALLDEIAARAEHLSTPPKPTVTAPKPKGDAALKEVADKIKANPGKGTGAGPRQGRANAPKAGMPTNAREKARGRVQQVPAPAQKPRQAGPDTRQKQRDAEKRLAAMIQNAPDTVAEARAQKAVDRALKNGEINDVQAKYLLANVDVNRGVRQANKPKPQQAYIDRAAKANDEDALAQIVEDADNDDGLSESEIERVFSAVERRAEALANGMAARNQQAEADAKREKRRKAIRHLKDNADAAPTKDLATGGPVRAGIDQQSAFNTKDRADANAVIDHVKVQRALDKVAQAKNEDDLVAIAQKVDRENHWTEHEREKIFEALSDRMKQIQSPKDAMYQKKATGKVPKEVNWHGRSEQSPAGRALAKGAKIEDLKDPDGLIDYIRAHPERFEINNIDNNQVSEAISVIDKKAQKAYFFKNTSNNGAANMYGDGMNEFMAAQLGRGAYPDLFPNVDWAGRPENGQNAWIRMDHLQEWAGDEFADVHYDAKDRWDRALMNLRGKPLKDPKQALAIHIFDYLIDQTDRHPNNYAWIDDPKGAILVPLDNGGAFHAYEAENYVKRLGKEVEDVTYKEWQGGRVGFMAGRKIAMMMDEARAAYSHKGWGRDKMGKDAEEIISAFGKVDIDAIMADLKRRFPNMDEYERQHMEGAALIWRNRLQNVRAEDIVRVMGL